MNSTDYLVSCLSTDLSKKEYEDKIKNELSSSQLRLSHAALGLSGETGEVTDIIKKYLMYGKEFDNKELAEELSDVLWYMSVILHEIGYTYNDIMELNINKLKKRYPNGFNKKDAIKRMDKNS